MNDLKNWTLKKETKDLCEQANSFYETFQIGSDLEKIGGLIQRMSMQIKYLQEKVDDQAKHIEILLDKQESHQNEIYCAEVKTHL